MRLPGGRGQAGSPEAAHAGLEATGLCPPAHRPREAGPHGAESAPGNRCLPWWLGRVSRAGCGHEDRKRKEECVLPSVAVGLMWS